MQFLFRRLPLPGILGLLKIRNIDYIVFVAAPGMPRVPQRCRKKKSAVTAYGNRFRISTWTNID